MSYAKKKFNIKFLNFVKTHCCEIIIQISCKIFFLLNMSLEGTKTKITTVPSGNYFKEQKNFIIVIIFFTRSPAVR